MSGIICAIRGGPASRATIAAAITLAGQTQLRLYFLYVINLDFLSHTTTSRVQVARDEILKMGEFILLTAHEEAAAQGITDVEVISREGKVAEEIGQVCAEVGADFVVLGRPEATDAETNVFSTERLNKLIAQIESECKAVVVLPQEDIE